MSSAPYAEGKKRRAMTAVIACVAPHGEGGLGQHLAEVVDYERAHDPLAAYFSVGAQLGDPLGRSLSIRWARWVNFLPPLRFRPNWRWHAEACAFDRAVAKRLQPLDRFIGFSGQCLSSFQRARRLGAKSLILVSPTAHPNHCFTQEQKANAAYPIERDPPSLAACRRALRECQMADVIQVSSQYARETFLEAGVPSEKLQLFPLHPAPKFQPPPIRPDDGVFRLVFCGALKVVKGVPALIQAFKRFSEPRAELTLIGGSGTRGMRRFMEQALRRDPRLRVRAGDPLPHYQRANACVHPSFQDGFGYAPMEALACGVPVIVSEDTGMKEYVRQGINGYIVPTGDVAAMTALFEQIKRYPLCSAR